MSQPNVENDVDAFKVSFKIYKRRDRPVDLSKVVDFRYPEKWKDQIVEIKAVDLVEGEEQVSELKSVSEWRIFEFLPNAKNSAGAGIIFIPNPFTDSGQLLWSVKCLKDFSANPPYKTNLDPFLDQIKSEFDAEIVATVDNDLTRNKLKQSHFSWWDSVQLNPDSKLVEKLRWSTLGFHHDWDSKVYNVENVSKFPAELTTLTRFILKRVPGYESFEYKPEAAIVNFYTMDSSIGGHTDHSEPNKSAPLASLSFGQSAIFLIGGIDKSIRPVALLLHSGDVILMTNDARQSYHAVPRILKLGNATNVGSKRDPASNNEGDEDFVIKYLSNHRININVRQVH